MIGYKYTKTMSISSHFTPFGIYPSNVFLKCNKPLYFCIKNDDDMEWIFFMIVYVIFSICTSENRKNNLVAILPEYKVLFHANIHLSDYEKDNNSIVLLLSGTHFNGWREYEKNVLPPQWEIMKVISVYRIVGTRLCSVT